MVSHRTEKRESAPSRAQRVASKGDIFYQTVRPYQKNNYLFDKDVTNYVFSTGYAQLRTTIHGGYFFTHGLHELQNCTSMWADTCLFSQSRQQRRSERSNASATRNNRPCRCLIFDNFEKFCSYFLLSQKFFVPLQAKSCAHENARAKQNREYTENNQGQE